MPIFKFVSFFFLLSALLICSGTYSYSFEILKKESAVPAEENKNLGALAASAEDMAEKVYGNKAGTVSNIIIFDNNMNAAEANGQKDSLAYLNFPIFTKIDSDVLDFLTPEYYTIFDMPSRDNAPIHRFNAGIEMNREFFQNDSDPITGALFDFIFGYLTKNIFSMNFNFIALKDDPNGVNMNFILKPIKNLWFKYSLTEEVNGRLSVFEMKVFPTKNTNVVFKTSENGKKTSTGIGFEMKF